MTSDGTTSKKSGGSVAKQLFALVFLFGIGAAIYVPARMKNRMAISGLAMGEIRSVVMSEIAYQSQNAGFFERRPECLARPNLCSPGRAVDPVLDASLAERIRTGTARQGYVLELRAGPVPASLPPEASRSSTQTFVVIASPPGPATADHALCGDASGLVCAFGPQDRLVETTPDGGVRCPADCPAYPGN